MNEEKLNTEINNMENESALKVDNETIERDASKINSENISALKEENEVVPVYTEEDLYPKTNAEYIFIIKHLFFVLNNYKGGSVEHAQLLKALEEIIAYLKDKSANTNIIFTKKDTNKETQNSMLKHFITYLKDLFNKGKRLKLEYTILKFNEKTDEYEVV